MAGRPKKHYDKSVYRSFALITQFGINMMVPICMLSVLGIYLDKRLDTSFLMVLFFFLGAIAGGQNVYRLAKRIYGTSGKNGNDMRVGAENRKESECNSEASGNIKK